MEEKQSSVRILVARRAGLNKAVLPECVNLPVSYAVLSVVSVLTKRRLRLLRVVSLSLRVLSPSSGRKLDSVVLPSDMDP